MAYSTQSDLLEQISEDELIELTDDAAAGVVDTDAVTRAIVDADAEIDGYCGKRHTVPFTTVPEIIRKLSVDLSIFNLYARRSHLEVPDSRQKRYDAAIRFLRDVARGIVSLGEDDPEGSPPDSNAPEMASTNPTRVFSRDTMSGF